MHLVYIVLRTTSCCTDRLVVYFIMMICRKEAAARSAKEMERAKLEAETALKEEAERLRKGTSTRRSSCFASSAYALLLRSDQMSCLSE